MNFMTKKSILIIAIAVLIIAAVSLFTLKPWQREAGVYISPPVSPKLPEEGEEIVIPVSAAYEDGTGVSGIRITFTETGQEGSWTQITGQQRVQGAAEFSVICGRTYIITAESNDSARSITQTIQREGMVGVLISDDDAIESVFYEEVRYP